MSLQTPFQLRDCRRGGAQSTITASLETIVSGTTTINAETYNGAIPGPTLRLNVGDTAIVRLDQQPSVSDRHSLARHRAGELRRWNRGDAGWRSPRLAIHDTSATGVPAGGTYLYKFKVTRPGIFWYHPHHHNSTNRVFRGCTG